MTTFRNLMEELDLIRDLNLEFENKESTWTPVKAPVDFSDELIMHIIELDRLRGSFFSRVWVIKDKESKKLIGIMTTSGLSEEGYSVITRQLLKKYTGKGLGSEALLSIFEHYNGLQSILIPEINRDILKIRIQESLFNMAEILLPPCKIAEFKDYFSRGRFSDINDFSRITNFFPNDLNLQVRSALRSLNKTIKKECFSGFISHPISEAAVRSLEKCGFVKSGGEYKKSCES